jgi:hypothetical protein
MPGMKADDRAKLILLRDKVARLHRALIESERREYERANGRIPSRGELLQLVVGHEWFAWLHPVSELIVQLDSLIDHLDALDQIDIRVVGAQVRVLMAPGETGGPLARQLHAAIQRDPAVVLAQGELSWVLSTAFAGPRSSTDTQQ